MEIQRTRFAGSVEPTRRLRDLEAIVWSFIPTALDRETSEIRASAKEIAEEMRIRGSDALRVLTLMCDVGAMRRSGGGHLGPYRWWLNRALFDKLDLPVDVALDCPWWRWRRSPATSPQESNRIGKGDGGRLAWAAPPMTPARAARLAERARLTGDLAALEKEEAALRARMSKLRTDIRRIDRANDVGEG